MPSTKQNFCTDLAFAFLEFDLDMTEELLEEFFSVRLFLHYKSLSQVVRSFRVLKRPPKKEESVNSCVNGYFLFHFRWALQDLTGKPVVMAGTGREVCLDHLVRRVNPGPKDSLVFRETREKGGTRGLKVPKVNLAKTA